MITAEKERQITIFLNVFIYIFYLFQVSTILLAAVALAELIYSFVKQFRNSQNNDVVPVEYITAILHAGIYVCKTLLYSIQF